MTLDEIIRKRRILITCGTGGVGKTTLSAAIALRSAQMGKKTVVITIDPAKRLATSLGLERLGDDPTDITALAKKIDPDFHGSLHAIVPDTKKTFENFVHELAPEPRIADKILHNPIFQIFAKEFSGANEYMALERLHALHQEEKYDLIVLDTPPSRNTLAFLDAPKLLTRLFEERLIRWLVVPANRLLAAGMRKALGILEKLAGAGFMTELVEFMSSLFEVQEPFTANLKRITGLLESEKVGFLMVTTAHAGFEREISHFIETLKNHHFRFDGVVLNRTLGYLEVGEGNNDDASELIRALQRRETQALKVMNPEDLIAKLPELSRDVHSIEDLFHVARAFG